MKRLRLTTVLVLLLLVVLHTRASIPSLMDEVIGILDKGYVNPMNRDITTWASTARTRFETTCGGSAPCALPVAERLVAASIESVGDPHLALFPIEALDYLAKGEAVGDAAHRFRYGFRARAGQALVVTYVQPESPAAEAGLRSGDTIRSVDTTVADPETALRNLTLLEKRRRPARLEVQRNNAPVRTLNVAPIIAESWKPSLLKLTDNTALLTLSDLRGYGTIDVLVHELLASAAKSGASKLILDLRFNRGGSPFGAISIAGAFLGVTGRNYTDKQGIVITFRYENGKQIRTASNAPDTEEVQELKNAVRWTGPVVVLVSDESLSAAENLTHLLQDAKRAKVIGQPTAGGLGVTAQSVSLSTGTGLAYSNTITTTLSGQRLPPRVTPDILVDFDLQALETGRDTMLERALQELETAGR